MRGTRTILNLAHRCIQKLNEPQNVKKGSWNNADPHELLRALRVELSELTYALNIWDTPDGHTKDTMRAVILECADVANYAAMLAEVVTEETNPRF